MKCFIHGNYTSFCFKKWICNFSENPLSFSSHWFKEVFLQDKYCITVHHFVTRHVGASMLLISFLTVNLPSPQSTAQKMNRVFIALIGIFLFFKYSAVYCTVLLIQENKSDPLSLFLCLPCASPLLLVDNYSTLGYF